MAAPGLSILPRTVASFYGSSVPRPYVVRDALGEVKQDRVAKPRVNAALVEWARAQSWSRGGLLADAVLRNAGRTADASGRRKLRAEDDDEDGADAPAAALRAQPRPARKPASKRRSRSAGSTPARKRPRKALEEEEEEAEWDAPESDEEDDAYASDSDEEGGSDDDGDARGVAETPARLAALRPGTGALVRAPAAFKRLRRASAASPPPPPPHTTPSVAAPPAAQTPAAPPRWRLKETKRVPTEPSPRVRPEATPHRSASAWSTPTPAKSLARTPSTSVKKRKAEKRRRRL